MFDAKSILEAMVNGAAPKPAAGTAPASGGGFGDILGQLTQMAQSAGAGGAGAAGAGAGGIGDMLRKMMPQGGAAAPQANQAQADAGGGMGGFGDILGKLQQAAGGAGAGGGNLMDILNKALGQATEGAREGASKIGASTGATDAIGKALGGMSSDDVMAKLKELVAQNQLGAGAAAGGLGAIVLGTHAGRSVAVGAAKLGALALIGGLTYKALLNYQNGQPLLNGAHTLTQAAPVGSGFEPAAVTNESATLYIKAMIAAAAADGRIDDGEMEKIMGGIKQGGMDAHAEEFLAAELNTPATVDELAAACTSSEQAVQVYTAARLAITPDGGAEDAFLAALGDKLGIDSTLAAHIDAAAKSAA